MQESLDTPLRSLGYPSQSTTAGVCNLIHCTHAYVVFALTVPLKLASAREPEGYPGTGSSLVLKATPLTMLDEGTTPLCIARLLKSPCERKTSPLVGYPPTSGACCELSSG